MQSLRSVNPHSHHHLTLVADEGRRQRRSMACSFRSRKKQEALREKRRLSMTAAALENSREDAAAFTTSCSYLDSLSQQLLDLNVSESLVVQHLQELRRFLLEPSSPVLINRNDSSTALSLTEALLSLIPRFHCIVNKVVALLVTLTLSENTCWMLAATDALIRCLEQLEEARQDLWNEGFVASLISGIHRHKTQFVRVNAYMAVLSLLVSDWERETPQKNATPIMYCALGLLQDKQLCRNSLATFTLQCLAHLASASSETATTLFRIGAWGLVQTLVQLLMTHQGDSNHNTELVLVVLIKLCQSELSARAVMATGFLSVAPGLLQDQEESILILTCKLLTKLVHTTSHNANATQCLLHQMIDSQAVSALVAVAQCRQWRIRKRALETCCTLVLANTTTEQMDDLLQHYNILELLVDALFVKIDNNIILKALHALEHILQTPGTCRLLMIDQYGGLDQLQYLKEHSDPAIVDKAEQVLELTQDEEETTEETASWTSEEARQRCYSPLCYRYDQEDFA